MFQLAPNRVIFLTLIAHVKNVLFGEFQIRTMSRKETMWTNVLSAFQIQVCQLVLEPCNLAGRVLCRTCRVFIITIFSTTFVTKNYFRLLT